MPEQNKTKRYFDLLRWLAQTGKEGIHRDSIISEYDISQKTFRRDIDEINELFPLLNLSYDKDTSRLTCSALPEMFPVKSSSNQAVDIINEVDDQINIFKHTQLQSDSSAYVLHFNSYNQHSLTNEQLSDLADAILKQNSIHFIYKNKNREGIPLFLCFYTVRWYLFCLSSSDTQLRKFRLDMITNISSNLISKQAKLPISKLSDIKKDALYKIKSSQNIFIDLTSKNILSVTFRFFFSQEYIKKEIIHTDKIKKTTTPDVTDVTISFSGYNEARIFMNKWIGHFQILSPEEIRTRYIDDIEDALGII
jgi:predicted DNA-binding transcriptional regulator YafY